MSAVDTPREPENPMPTTLPDDWTATLPGSRFNPISLGVELVCLATGSTLLRSALESVMLGWRRGNIFDVAVAFPLTVIGSFFAIWAAVALYRRVHRARIDVAGRSVRLRRSILGVQFADVALELADCRTPALAAGSSRFMTLGRHRFPVASGAELGVIVKRLEEGTATAIPEARPAC